MAQLNVKMSEQDIDALRRYAARRRTPVAWLIKDYIKYLLDGGDPVTPPDDDVPSKELQTLAQRGGSFNWLAEEPEIYSATDGEPV